MAKIIIIYGSTGGNTEIVCHKVAHILESQKHKVTLKRAELSSPKDISGYSLCILGASTYGHGIIQDHMIPFVGEMKNLNFKNQNFAVIGLGDAKYDAHYNIESAVILESVIRKTKGDIIHGPLLINESPVWQMKKIEKWAYSLINALAGKPEVPYSTPTSTGFQDKTGQLNPTSPKP